MRVKSPVRPGHWFGYVAALQKTKPSKFSIVPLEKEEMVRACEYEIQITKYETFKMVNFALGEEEMGWVFRNHLNVSPFPGNEQSDSRDWITFVELQSLIASEKFTNSFDQL